jgi:hypothetical protein
LVLYGSVINRNTSQPLTSGQVTWQITNQTDSVSISVSIISVNEQFFYVAFVPMETRTIGGQTFSASANALGLPAAPSTFSRSATVGGTNATIVFSSRGTLNTFTLGPGDRGVIERVDLQIGVGETFAQWLAQYGLPPTTDPNADPLGKGMTYYQQFIAGTDPANKNSVFEIVDIRPDAQGLNLIWTSFTNKLYTLERVDSLNGGFVNSSNFILLQQHIVASPPLNTFRDVNGTGPGQHFYRVRVE